MSTAAQQNAESTSKIRSRTSELKKSLTNGDSSSKEYVSKHAYGKVDMNDPQIIGGGKERTLVHYTPGINITEKGMEQDKKMDQHHE